MFMEPSDNKDTATACLLDLEDKERLMSVKKSFCTLMTLIYFLTICQQPLSHLLNVLAFINNYNYL